jgi:hypothetical protein
MSEVPGIRTQERVFYTWELSVCTLSGKNVRLSPEFIQMFGRGAVKDVRLEHGGYYAGLS